MFSLCDDDYLSHSFGRLRLDTSSSSTIGTSVGSKIKKNRELVMNILSSVGIDSSIVDEDEIKKVIKDGNVFELKELSSTDMDYDNIKDQFLSSMMQGKQPVFRSYSVKGVTKVICPYLYLQYKIKLLKKRDNVGYVSQETVFHGTTKANIQKICLDNFDWRKSGRHVGHKFGKGISFAKYETYATFYPKTSEFPRAILVTNILVSGKQPGNRFMEIPSEGYDTSINPKGEVIVKYDDAEFYPFFIIYYS